MTTVKMALIEGKRTLVDVSEAAHGQTWEGRWIYRGGIGRRLKEFAAKDIKTKTRCPICDLRFLRKPFIRPIGRVVYVEGPPVDGLQPVIYQPLTPALSVVKCSSKICHGAFFTLPKHRLSELTNVAS